MLSEVTVQEVYGNESKPMTVMETVKGVSDAVECKRLEQMTGDPFVISGRIFMACP